MPLPMISRSVRPVSLETSAQVRRETTADLIFVKSPSRYSGKRRYKRLADDQVEHRIAEELHALVAVKPVVGDGGVGEGLEEQLLVLELIAEDFLGLFT